MDDPLDWTADLWVVCGHPRMLRRFRWRGQRPMLTVAPARGLVIRWRDEVHLTVETVIATRTMGLHLKFEYATAEAITRAETSTVPDVLAALGEGWTYSEDDR